MQIAGSSVFNKALKIFSGHFTQEVWKECKEIGVGVAADGKGAVFAVANYFPPGNYRNQFRDNVKPPQA